AAPAAGDTNARQIESLDARRVRPAAVVLGYRPRSGRRRRAHDAPARDRDPREARHEDVSLDPGTAQALFVSRYRAMPGKAGEYMAFVHTETYPVMVKAKANGTMAGMGYSHPVGELSGAVNPIASIS